MEPNKKDKARLSQDAIPNFDDKSVRDQIKKKDYDVIKQTYEDLAREEEELKGFFKDLKTPTKEDPTLIRKQQFRLTSNVNMSLIIKYVKASKDIRKKCKHINKLLKD